ncbi:MAG: M81 family metallopeptidase [Acetobacteraceae bacterium]|nr:M81 family metallopeptidase [Acetobacteraceae bacterium]
MRIAVGGFLHESHSFAPRPAAYADFLQPGGFPPLTRGDAVIPMFRDKRLGLSGAIEVAEAVAATIVPLAWACANPAGPVQDEAFERIAALLCAGLSDALDAGKLDGVYLDLHGAGVCNSFPDLEGELLRRVRHIVGSVPVTASLDPHANLTQLMVNESDALAPYLTYPHVDMREAGARATRLLLQRIEAGRPFAKAYRQLDYWIPITSQCTLVDPMAAVMAEREAIMAQTGAEIAWCFGFPYADFPGCGAAFASYASSEATAHAAADRFLAALNRREPQFQLAIPDAAEAVAAALREVGPGGPVVIADTQDNPGGGGHGDTTGLLAELVRQGARGAVVCLINDAESAARSHAAGEGAAVALALGGKSDGAPLPVQARVLRLTDGRFTLTGPMTGGNPANLGPCALIEIEPGVRVVVVSRKMQALDQAILRHVGIEPSEAAILALKSSVHFRADFGQIARRIIVAAAPGPVVADPATLPFRNLRPGLRLRPGANA